MASQVESLIYGLLILLTFIFVVLTAVWARSAERREAAFRVLDRLLHALVGR